MKEQIHYKKINLIAKDGQYRIIAFFLCLGAFFLYYSWMSLIKGGTAFLLSGDTFALYVPLTRQFFRDLMNGESLGFSWSNGLGMNAVPLYTSYVGGSIFNIFFLLMPKVNPATVLTMVIALKVALTGACFVFFMEKGLNQKGIHTILFALMYAMSGAQMTIYIQNYIWMDAEYILPVLLVLVMEFAKTGRWCKMLFAYAYLFLCSYFTGYTVGFFSAFFFFLYLLMFVKKEIVKRVVGFVMTAIGAACVCAFALLPTIVFLLTKAAPDATAQESLHIGIKQLLSSFLVGGKFEMQVQQPYFYVGMLSFIMLIAFYVCKRISSKEKMFWGVLCGILILSCLIAPIYLFWHGFDTPDGWFYRFSYLVTFVITAMACLAWGRENDHSEVGRTISLKKYIVIAGCGLLCIGIAGIFWNGVEKSSIRIILSVVIVGILMFAMWLNKQKKEGKEQMLFTCVLIAFCGLEMIGNGCGYWGSKFSDYRVQNFLEVGKQAVRELKRDDSFYRVNFTNCRNWNWDSFFGMYGNSDFGTLENYEVRNSLSKLGAYTSPRMTLSYGQNPVTQLLLGVKYNIKGRDDYNPENNILTGAVVSQYEKNLSLGYMVNGEIEDFHLSEGSIYENCNNLLSTMTGTPVEVFTEYDLEKIYVVCDNMDFQFADTQYYINIQDVTKGIGQITFFTENVQDGNGLFATFDNGISLQHDEGAVILKDTDEANDAGSLGVRYSNELRNKNGRYEISVAMSAENLNRADVFKDFYFYESHPEQIEKAYDYLKKNQLQIKSVRNGYVEGNIYVGDNQDILFTTIPYDAGWKLESEKQGVEMIPVLDGAFIGVKFPETGDYELTWKYTVPGWNVGVGISCVSLGLIVILRVSEQMARKRKAICKKDSITLKEL